MTTTATVLTLNDIREAHPVFFSPSSMRFWGSRVIDSTALPFEDGLLFITSEHNFDRSARLYTIRFANLNTIEEIGEFQDWATLASAKRALRYFYADTTN